MEEIFDASTETKELNAEKMIGNSSNIHGEGDGFDRLQGESTKNTPRYYACKLVFGFGVYVKLQCYLFIQSH